MTYGLDQFKFGEQVLGYISEEGLAWGGDKPEKVKINAAQIKGGPVKVITKNNGTNVITFKLIQLDGAHCKDVMGGTVAADGTYTPPEKVEDLVGVADIKCASGHTIRVFMVVFPLSFPVILMVVRFWLSSANWKCWLLLMVALVMPFIRRK